MSYALGMASIHNPQGVAVVWFIIIMGLAMFGSWHLGMAVSRRLDTAMRRHRRRQRRAERQKPTSKSP